MNLAVLGGLPIGAAWVAVLAACGGHPDAAGWTALAAGTLAWLGLLAYGTVHPEARLFGPVVSRGDAGRRRLALTFDDGPNEPYTSQLLDVLRAEGVRATFFLVGANAEASPGVVRRIAAAGHEIGNHAYDHRALIGCGAGALARQLDATQATLARACGRTPGLFRPPFGLRDPRVLAAARARGLTVVQWSVWAWDWECPGVERIEAAVLAGAHPGAIVLLHDGSRAERGTDRSQTVEAVRRVIPRLREAGYELVTVPELLAGGGEGARERAGLP